MKATKLIAILLSLIALGVLGAFLHTQLTQKEQQVLPTSQPDETNEGAYCNSDSDCWCRSFTGAEFVPGEKVPHVCNIETKRCLPCYYD